mmetsp:Transcript_55661/g.156162  ORF Transcript_55661/g.156162 Transcript_55661/m.156162 type:complete len:117 (-) Transcript_55661:64-414(-)
MSPIEIDETSSTEMSSTGSPRMTPSETGSLSACFGQIDRQKSVRFDLDAVTIVEVEVERLAPERKADVSVAEQFADFIGALVRGPGPGRAPPVMLDGGDAAPITTILATALLIIII